MITAFTLPIVEHTCTEYSGYSGTLSSSHRKAPQELSLPMHALYEEQALI